MDASNFPRHEAGLTLEQANRACLALARAANAPEAKASFEALLAERRRREPITFYMADFADWLRRCFWIARR